MSENPQSEGDQQSLLEKIGQVLLPTIMPEIPGYELHARYWPADPTGIVTGDYYDSVVLDGKYINFAIGDVAGKGLKAAAWSVGLRFMWRVVVANSIAPSLALQRLNKALAVYLETDGYITMLCGCIAIKTGQVRYACAGHPPPMLYRRTGTCEHLAMCQGQPLGITPDSRFETARVHLRRGDSLILYTDGISDLRRGEGGEEWLEVDALLRWVESTPGRELTGLITHLHREACLWSCGKLHDDIALLAIRRNG